MKVSFRENKNKQKSVASSLASAGNWILGFWFSLYLFVFIENTTASQMSDIHLHTWEQ